MKQDKVLVIMAAGMGSRFGGLKQLEPMGPTGEFIIDYSIYDAIKEGFTKVVIIIKKENYDLFRETVGKRIEDRIEVQYVYQEMNDIPEGFSCPTERIKPWGTGQAILATEKAVNGNNFIVINADDFYGRDAFTKASEFLNGNNNSNIYGMIAYRIANTLTDNGSVKRGVCHINDLGELDQLTECKVERIGNDIVAAPINGDPSFVVGEDRLVSMNCLGFTSKIYDYLKEFYAQFFQANQNDLMSCEFLIPDVINSLIADNKITMQVLSTTSEWQGVTYKEDKDKVVRFLADLVK
ncbi:MAG: sugar phosphate nucleotidyltransferase [Bacilli bacterium]